MEDIPGSTIYMRQDTRMTRYLPYPVFLLDLSISQTAKVLYALLLNRAMLSQKNEWFDDEGRVYIMFTIEEMSNEMNKSQATIKKALADLYNYGLLERKRLSPGSPSVLYVKILQTDNNLYPAGIENDTSEVLKTIPGKYNFLAPSNYKELTDNREPDGVMDQRKVYGRFTNVLLTDEEYELLQADFSQLSRYIEELSAYLAANGRTYINYEAGIRLWASKDRKTSGHDIKDQDYSCEEGESY